MPPERRRAELSPQDEIARLLALQVRLQLRNQAQTIIELDRIGFSPKRIAELLGTTANTVSVTVQKSRKRGTKEAG